MDFQLCSQIGRLNFVHKGQNIHMFFDGQIQRMYCRRMRRIKGFSHPFKLGNYQMRAASVKRLKSLLPTRHATQPIIKALRIAVFTLNRNINICPKPCITGQPVASVLNITCPLPRPVLTLTLILVFNKNFKKPW